MIKELANITNCLPNVLAVNYLTLTRGKPADDIAVKAAGYMLHIC